MMTAIESIRNRYSGLLLHITSLPSYYGIGDLGPASYEFADFLYRTGQRYWQILPINPVDGFTGYSPYSGISAFAGNTLLISPELLYQLGFVSEDDLSDHQGFPEGTIDFEKVSVYKENLFQRAYENFIRSDGHSQGAFTIFCDENSCWLDDYAMYVTMKKHFGRTGWTEWPQDIKRREEGIMNEYEHEFAYSIRREMFLQYIFWEQWKNLKGYCNRLGIKIFGDIPFYVNHDSADVWVHPHLFRLREDLSPEYVSGVPPDYYSDSGQLWGTPVYNWENMRLHGFGWWKDRIGHNLKMTDLLRLDHFRAFAAYWEVPAGEPTAMNGKWVASPGHEFFHELGKHFASLPLVAEDLGIIDAPVRELMEEFSLPGMKVLQFAFDDDMPRNPYVPHHHAYNCLVYTGTHDNNTIRGWFEDETGEAERHRIRQYLNRQVDADNAADAFIHLAMSSVASTVIIPVQDLLGLGSDAVMNRPSSATGNWKWRLRPSMLGHSQEKYLQDLVTVYGRHRDLQFQ
jgi:4-alpha-glucanotransferase